MNLAAEFSAWVQEPRRTNDELYLAELLVESGHEKWRYLTNAPWSNERYYKQVEHRKKRMLDPAYRPKISRKKLNQTEQVWDKIEGIATAWINDRPVRDLTALRYFPQLTTIDIASELTNLDGLKVLANLRKLRLCDETLADLSALAYHPQLEDLSLRLYWPWPDLRSLAELPALKRLDFYGNILALADIGPLSALENVNLDDVHGLSVPLREVAQLPDMPRAKNLKVVPACQLRGLERYNGLEKLHLAGPFGDLAPVAALPNLRELTLHGEYFRDVEPLARLPRLRSLELKRQRGIDLTPLSDSPTLRQVKSDSKVLQTELAMLNAALGYIDPSEFLAPKPRPLLPLRYLVCQRDADMQAKTAQRKEIRDEREEVYGDDPLMRPAELNWFKKQVEEKLAAFGDSKWIRIADLQSALMVELYRVQEAAFVTRMIEAVHPLLRAARFRWEIIFRVALDEEPDEDNWEMPDRSVFDVEREREEWEEQQQYQKEREQVIEREHLMSLQAPSTSKGDESAILADEGDPDETDKAMNEDGSAPEKDDDDRGLLDTRHFRFWLDGDIVWMLAEDRNQAAEFLYDVKVEDWHQLPEPPEQRPQWRCW